MASKEITPTEARTLKMFRDCHMNMAQTGRVLGYHGSTISYQISRVRMKTGLNPFDSDDLEKLLQIKPKEGFDLLSIKDIMAIRELAICDMNVSKTAINLEYNYSSLVYRYDSIYDKTGLNPRCFFDLIELLKRTADREE